MWQWTSVGRLNGYNGNLDCSVFYGDRSAWEAFARPRTTTPPVTPEPPVVVPPVAPTDPIEPPTEPTTPVQPPVDPITPIDPITPPVPSPGFWQSIINFFS